MFISETVNKRVLPVTQPFVVCPLIFNSGSAPTGHFFGPGLIDELQHESIADIAHQGEGDETKRGVKRDEISIRVLGTEELCSNYAGKIAETIHTKNQGTFARVYR
jgi:hypothetical protein